ncbi:MAG: RNA polymerase sigma factor [Myxococcota bacterium]
MSEPPPSGVRPLTRRRSRAAAESLTDEDVIAAVRSGDQRVARLLHERLLGVVDLTLYRVFGRREADHDDLIQAVFEQIVRTLALNSYARGCNLRTWAATLASHVAFTALRSRRRERRVFDRAVVVDLTLHLRSIDGEAAAAARYDLQHLRRHLIAMNPARAEVLFLHDVQGEKLNEVAKVMRISTAAATSRLVRARRELSQRLDLERAREQRTLALRAGRR